MFPSTGIIIKKNAHPSSFYSKRSSSYVQEAREKLSATTNNIQKNYPVLISVPTVNNTFNFQKLKKNSNALSYEAPDLDKKMITGNLPKSFFGETGKSSETRKTEIKRKLQTLPLGECCEKISLKLNVNYETLEYKLHHVFWKQDIVVNNIQKMLLSGHRNQNTVELK